jgi:hypothetical protein
VHALERVGEPSEVAAVVAHCSPTTPRSSPAATVPVDGGRAALAREPQP